MKKFLQNILFYVLYGTWCILSLLPLWFHYILADILYVLVAHVVHYRHRVIDKNLAHAFPELSDVERRRLKNRFYHFFCDFIAELVKFSTMHPNNIKRRMVFHGAEQVRDIINDGQDVALMLGHCGNWEWMTSYPLWFEGADAGFGQVAHTLENPVMERLICAVRNRFGSQTIAMKETLRWLLQERAEGHPTILAYISDQVPTWQNIHHWIDFMNQDTPVFTGVERIARKLNQAVVYVDMQRVKRGYYEAEVQVITRDPNSLPEFAITDDYFRRLEAAIRRTPQYWLWSHNRWKRTREEFNRKFEVVNGRVIERK
ncbi:MAG: lysophospholipid acyltransferase family protein [Muribaculaceae bacterium]|nr:lysophospholipid acyltransferase family protein [Muribaculaceae bacterium]